MRVKNVKKGEFPVDGPLGRQGQGEAHRLHALQAEQRWSVSVIFWCPHPNCFSLIARLLTGKPRKGSRNERLLSGEKLGNARISRLLGTPRELFRASIKAPQMRHQN